MTAPATVNAYIGAAPETAQPVLRALREAIRAAAPQVVEGSSYGMPAFGLNGRLAYFALHRAHVGLYPFGPDDAEAASLAAYLSGKATLQFPLDQALPDAAIRRAVARRGRARRRHTGRPVKETPMEHATSAEARCP